MRLNKSAGNMSKHLSHISAENSEVVISEMLNFGPVISAAADRVRLAKILKRLCRSGRTLSHWQSL